jgi:aryl-alcohol dehydrogenase-like predicted oxidoreductase
LEVSDPGGEGLSPDRFRAARDASLRRLGVETMLRGQMGQPDLPALRRPR